MSLSVKELEELKGKLPKGYYKRVKTATGLSVGTLNKFFNGTAYRTDIHTAVIAICEEYETEKKLLSERTKEIIESNIRKTS